MCLMGLITLFRRSTCTTYRTCISVGARLDPDPFNKDLPQGLHRQGDPNVMADPADDLAGSPETPSSTPQPLALARSLEEVVRLATDPVQELREFGVLAKGLHVVVLARQFGLGQQGVNLAVADPMKPGCLNPTARLRHQVMGIALRRWNRPVAQRAHHRGQDVGASRD